jgi:hypothetical protein
MKRIGAIERSEERPAPGAGVDGRPPALRLLERRVPPPRDDTIEARAPADDEAGIGRRVAAWAQRQCARFGRG